MTPKNPTARLLSCLAAVVLSAGCAAHSSSHGHDEPRPSAQRNFEDGEQQRAAAETSPGESDAFRDAAERFLEYLAAQRRNRPDVVQASAKDPIIPRYECMDYGCPDTVLCKKAHVYCAVTHCGKGSCNTCPKPMPDVFKNLVFKQWCEFECLRGSTRLGTVLGFVPSIGSIFIGPFGCPDEYSASNCSCTTKAGYMREVNGNCQNCATSFTPCLMAGNTWEMCAFTPAHLGWRDTDGDGALDPVDPVGNPNPLIDLGGFCSRVPFICRLVGLGATVGAVAGDDPGGWPGVTGAITPEPRGEAVPVELLRQVLTADEMERVETAVRAEEDRYLESLERKLQTAVDQIARERARR